MNIKPSNNYTNNNFYGYGFYKRLNKDAIKQQILKSKTIEEAADTFEQFANNERDKNYEKVFNVKQKFQISAMLCESLLCLGGILAGAPTVSMIGIALGLGTMYLTDKILDPLLKSFLDKDLIDNYYQAMIDEGIYDLNIAKKYLTKDYKKHKAETQSNLINWLDTYYINTPNEDNEKLKNYIMNHYDEYYWNQLIPFCLRYSSKNGCHNDDMSCNYENFMKLKNMSESVYYMYHNTIGHLKPKLNLNNSELYEMFKKEYPYNNFCEFLYNNWRRDKNGIISDEEVSNFRKVFGKQGPHYALWVLRLCKNKDGYIAWDCAKIFQEIAHMIDSNIYDDYKDFDDQTLDMHLNNILVEIAENSFDKDGILNKNKLDTLYRSIKSEIDTVGIKNSKTLKKILNSYTRTKLGIFDDNIESVEDAINKPNRLFDEIQRKSNIANYLKDAKCSPSEVFGLLYKLTTTEEGKTRIINEFSSNPRIGLYIKDLLIEKLGDDKKAENYFNTWFYDEKYGYRKAYNDYYKHEFYENAADLITLIKQSPNIGTWAFKNKAKELGVELTLGELPHDIGTEEDFKELLKQLKILDKKMVKQQTNIEKKVELEINGKKYLVKKINSGHSAKIKYIIKQECEGSKTYVLKFSPYNVIGNTDRSGKLNDSFMLRGDSPYLDAMVDFYLKENKCENAPDIKYFDYKEKAVLYEMTIGKQLKISDMDFYNAYLLNNSAQLKDVKDLGILINDINYKNIIETKDGILKIVDTGHAGFQSPFRPMVQGFHISLSNLCGREMN